MGNIFIIILGNLACNNDYLFHKEKTPWGKKERKKGKYPITISNLKSNLKSNWRKWMFYINHNNWLMITDDNNGLIWLIIIIIWWSNWIYWLNDWLSIYIGYLARQMMEWWCIYFDKMKIKGKKERIKKQEFAKL